jgi:hypothetical protein
VEQGVAGRGVYLAVHAERDGDDRTGDEGEQEI